MNAVSWDCGFAGCLAGKSTLTGSLAQANKRKDISDIKEIPYAL
jgi:hypothetical protein